jgi:predicted transcriptional regulator
MKTIQVSDQTKQKLEQLAERQHRSESEIVDELVARFLPNGRLSAKGILEGKADNLVAAADFKGLHEDMEKLYGPDAE